MERKQLVIGGGTKQELRCGVWRIRHNMGYDPEAEKYRYSPWRNVYTTSKHELREALEEYKRELNNGLLDEKNNMTVGEYATRFHEMRANTGMSPLSYKRESLEIRYLCELFGGVKLVNLKSLTIKETYARVREEKLHSENTLHSLHVRLKQILQEAVDDELIPKNPCAKISVPRPKPAERAHLSEEEAARLLSVLEASPADSRIVAVYLMLMTGMRKGEALGLTWRYVSFSVPEIYVVQQYASDRTLRAPKSDKSRRHIGLEPDTANYLAAWKVEQARQLSELGIRQDLDTPVVSRISDAASAGGTAGGNAVAATFTDPANFDKWFHLFCVENGFGRYEHTGRMYVYKVLDGKRWKRRQSTPEEYRALKDSGKRVRFEKSVIKNSGYTGLTAHVLRHTHATLLIGAGVDLKTVQARLGHAQLSTTMDVYAHAIAAKDSEAAAAFNGVITHRSIEDIIATQIETSQLESIPLTNRGVQKIAKAAGPRSGAEAAVAVREFALAQAGEFTKRQAMDACRIKSQKWMSNALVGLQREGVIRKMGNSKDARYRTVAG